MHIKLFILFISAALCASSHHSHGRHSHEKHDKLSLHGHHNHGHHRNHGGHGNHGHHGKHDSHEHHHKHGHHREHGLGGHHDHRNQFDKTSHTLHHGISPQLPPRKIIQQAHRPPRTSEGYYVQGIPVPGILNQFPQFAFNQGKFIENSHPSNLVFGPQKVGQGLVGGKIDKSKTSIESGSDDDSSSDSGSNSSSEESNAILASQGNSGSGHDSNIPSASQPFYAGKGQIFHPISAKPVPASTKISQGKTDNAKKSPPQNIDKGIPLTINAGVNNLGYHKKGPQ